jgi:hypothetical protein
MADRSLRGMGISYRSLETDEGVEFADRVDAFFDCPSGHTVVVTFFAEADLPITWMCRCGAQAVSRDCEDAVLPTERRPRTHWEMLLERRTIPELEELLAERLEILRANRGRGRGTRRASRAG